MSAVPPLFRDLDINECQQILARNRVGRIAYSFHDRVDIEPLHYVFAGGVIYMRTGTGSKLETLAHSPWVAFEVDEVDGPFDWRSVVAHGTVYVLADVGATSARESYQQAVEQLRNVTPNALAADDPTPDRTVILKIHPATITGRAARSTRPRAPHRA
jgi:nitroimidazol reductase NimA-like FMN-containing flavoprotein (pyridoxamine 5'-phosphate oxidase superfamily)